LYIGVTRTLTQDRDEFGTIGTSEGEESLRECGRNPADRCCKHGEQAGEEYASAQLPRALCKSDELTLLHDSAIPDDYFFEDLTILHRCCRSATNGEPRPFGDDRTKGERHAFAASHKKLPRREYQIVR
jgi:hypothetical protein